jgi:hypothetical protein
MTEIAHVLPPPDTRSRHAANADIRRNYNDYAGVKSTHRRLWLFINQSEPEAVSRHLRLICGSSGIAFR